MLLKTQDFRPRSIKASTDADVEKLQPRAAKYHASIEGIPGLRITVYPTGRKAWESNIKHPFNKKTLSKTHGTFPNIKLKAADRFHQEFYSQLRSGDDPVFTSARQKRKLQAFEILRTPIAQLGYELVETKLNRGELTSGYNDYWAIKKIEHVIGKASFSSFNERLCDQLSRAYPNDDIGWSKRDKVKKQLIKIYNSLASDVRGELRLDIPHLLNQRFGKIQQRNRSKLHIPSGLLTEFWIRLITAPVPDIHKDFLILCLLTGERKDALLSIRLEQIHMEAGKPLILYTEGKRIDGDPHPSPNLIPITPMIGLLLRRLVKNAKLTGSQYLFPGQRGNKSKHLTNLSKYLIDWLGKFGSGVGASAHNIRRTTAHEAAVAIGDIRLADTHILHPQKHFKGSRANYFSPQAIEFCDAKRPTYEKVHQRIDDLILSNAILVQKNGFLDESTDDYEPGNVIGVLRGQSNQLSLYPPIFEESNQAEVVSPLASFCKGNLHKVPVSNRPLFRKALRENELETILEQVGILEFEKQVL